MKTCENCGAELDPSWKFCVTCGAPTESAAEPAAEPTLITPIPVATLADSIPSAIRPDADDDDDLLPPPKKTDWALVVGVLLAVGGVALIVLVAVAIFSHR